MQAGQCLVASQTQCTCDVYDGRKFVQDFASSLQQGKVEEFKKIADL